MLAVLALAAYRGGSLVLVIVVAAYVLAAALAIEVLDTGFSDERAEVVPEARRPPRSGQAAAAGGVLGLVCGLSPFYAGGYDSSLWAPAGLVLLSLVLALVVGRPLRLGGPAKLALGALAGLAGWSLLSVLWSSSPELGFVSSNRMVLLGAILAAALLIVPDTRGAAWALGGAVAGTVVVGLWSVGVMLAGEGVALFSNGRLNDPLGYINAQGGVYAFVLFPLLALVEWRRSSWQGAVGAGLGTLCLGLAFLSESRGVIVALVAGIVVVFAVSNGRLLRAAALAVMALPVAAASPQILEVYDRGTIGTLTGAPVRSAAVALVLAALASGLIWWLLARVAGRASAGRLRVTHHAWAATLAIAAVAIVVVGAVKAPQIDARVREQYHSFVDLGTSQTSAEASQQQAAQRLRGPL